MSSSYKFIDHTGDIAVELEAGSLEELFTAGAEAWKHSVTNSKPEADDSMEFELSAQSREELLIDFLNEINFRLYTKKWLFCDVESIKIMEHEKRWECSVSLSGVNVNNEVTLKTPIKAVTYNQVEIFKKKKIFSTRVVFET